MNFAGGSDEFRQLSGTLVGRYLWLECYRSLSHQFCRARELARSRAQENRKKKKGKCHNPGTEERKEELRDWRCRMKFMTKRAISRGAVHSVPADLRKVLISDAMARAKWEDITPLARNEWICWVISVKKPETRRQHIERVRTELKEGMRRPCCWPGCPHR